ncbi:LEAF RUST 10 DISEASE-RESISTANCE LOCUS RECEPTOR-LIKE PROTEIN KINASE-like 1.2 isoform X1 [Phalaenopsis equestris]|uniref:LEAF RUST 10 DISEASE-RESISTANCE LOCUS RECEPTOR-LIKE PROTEIN KINASE-like 1.2 isoform X1 n=1 Tax=Phalaenopsis equestris TaxID=78828 RepID=UPI0009E19421|nr:LEAF RUST 10 DISEASE-RESISTANCE LOCUS RECEPTOR-LIKE PROTEIN KINASE-like 1.2 isoform X1 [Phalaenopsis equestris]
MSPSTKLHLPPHTALSLSPFLTTLLLSLLPPSHPSPIPNCSPSSCGNSSLQIPYPFWLPHDSPNSLSSHCGYPDLMLDCHNNNIILSLPNAGNYTITSFNISSHTLTLIDTDAIADATCPHPLYNLSIYSNFYDSTLTFTSEDTELFFYYNCSQTSVTGDVPLRCSDGGKSSYVLTQDMVFPGADCAENVVAPVMHAAVLWSKSFLSGDVVGVMREGFQLHWNVGGDDDCRRCEDSGGLCGHGLMGFVCFCQSGIKEKHCGEGKATANSKRNKGLIIGISVAGGFSAAIVSSFCFLMYKKEKKRRGSTSTVNRIVSFQPFSKSDPELGSSLHAPIFKYDELYEATNGFDGSRELGDGGFGTVYKGKLRDGRVVAVKRLYETNYRRVEQFMNEVNILSLLRHHNLVSLYGCTSRHSRELLLVYEFVPNGTVADHLHGSRASESFLPWQVRMTIAIETADALRYLHSVEPQIIHRDIKTNNLLLDNNFHVKVADFGLSRLFPLDATHVSTAPQGTPGYVDPEYHQCYQLTDKSDVYSFGVVLMELISSKPAVDVTRQRNEINLAKMAIDKIQRQELHEFVDQKLGYQSDYNISRMINQVAELAFQCLQTDREMRPSIKDVLDVLTEIESGGRKNGSCENVNAAVKEEARLLKSSPPHSPNSVTTGWLSMETTPNTSG